MAMPRKTLEEFFWSRVKKADGCWAWTGSVNKEGRGHIGKSVLGRTISAPRASWLLHFGAPEAGKNILHRCENKLCVNPGHLFLGSRLEREPRVKWAEADLNAASIREQLDYDPETGNFKWKMSRPGIIPGQSPKMKATKWGYLRITILGVTTMAHRLAWLHHYGRWPEGDIDHANRDRGDNRITNLREATRSQNLANKKTRRNGLKGVTFHKHRGRWSARANKDGKAHHFGYFDTEEEAHAAYCTGAVKLHGEFARFK